MDEINQGLDETNERAVWEMLLATATEYSAQYFYLAPKFPRQLEFTDDMTVTTCNSGLKASGGLLDKGKDKEGMSLADVLKRVKQEERSDSRACQRR